jgi:hypothetical protein
METVTKPVPNDEELGSYRGWAIGGGVIVAVLFVGLGLWFWFHGL